MSARQKPQCRAKTRYPDRAAAELAKAELLGRDTTVKQVEVIQCPKCPRWHLRVGR